MQTLRLGKALWQLAYISFCTFSCCSYTQCLLSTTWHSFSCVFQAASPFPPSCPLHGMDQGERLAHIKSSFKPRFTSKVWGIFAPWFQSQHKLVILKQIPWPGDVSYVATDSWITHLPRAFIYAVHASLGIPPFTALLPKLTSLQSVQGSFCSPNPFYRNEALCKLQAILSIIFL